MRLILCLVLQCLFSVPLFAQNLHFDASAGTDSEDIGIHFVVTDPANRRTGFLPTPGEIPEPLSIANLQEVPDASYLTNRLGSEDGDVDFEGIQFYSSPIVVGTYTVSVYGISDCKYTMRLDIYKNRDELLPVEFSGFVSNGSIVPYAIFIDPAKPILPEPIVIKAVTFNTLKQNLNVAWKLNQIGEDKFLRSLTKNIDLAEKLAGVCDRRKGKKDKGCQPAVAVLKLFIKRLELANRKCDNPADCDEEREWTAFREEHGKDADFKDFWREWDRDDWHKHKKSSKRFATDEALKIISEDAGWLIKSLGGAVEDNRDKGKKD